MPVDKKEVIMLTIAEVHRPIEDFPNYEVTNFGRFFNIKTGREMALSPTMNGDLTVGFTRYGKQVRFSAKGVVARTFVPGENEIFNCPILLDCDKTNLHADNIMWRPRWFAWHYHRQFTPILNWYFWGPVIDRATMEEYRDILVAATTFGLLCKDIFDSMHGGRPTFPTRQDWMLK
jgi:hypothetical protein